MKFLQVISIFASAASALQYKGADWSSLLVEEAGGKTYKNSAGTVQPLETILKNSGVNTVRQRLWVKPSNGNYNLDYNIKLAKRAKAAGLNVYLDLHFSDTWADPAHQTTPSGWPADINNLAWKVYNYTLDTSNAFSSAGVPLSIISIGNEITAGLLWPLGKTNNFYNIARLLHSASSGIKDSKLNPKPRIMIHIDNGWNWGTQQWWYTNVLGAGPLVSADYDMMGVSFYPFYNTQATLNNLRSSLANMASTWGKELVVAETNWPGSCPSPSQGISEPSIPISISGQTTWIQRVASTVSGVSRGVGLFYWEPAWIRNAGLGSSCADNLLVDQNGKVRASMAVFSSI